MTVNVVWQEVDGLGPKAELGADLWRFPSESEPAQAVTQTGFGNPMNFGIRNMVSGAFCLDESVVDLVAA